MNEYILIILTFIVSIGLILLFFPISRLIHLIDIPDRKLKKHKKGIPQTGGTVLFIVFIIVTLLMSLKGLISLFNPFIIGFTAIYVLGLIDDYLKLSPIPKLITQSIIILYLLLNGIIIDINIFPQIVNYALTFLWILGIMNAFNLMDIMDGFAGGIALIIAITLLFINITSSNSINILFISTLIGFLFAFLIFNKPKARIYLGDSGSLLIGYSLAYFSIITTYTAINNLAFFTPLLIFGIPIFDTTFVVLRRMISRKNPLHGSDDHFVLKLGSIVNRKGFIVFTMMLFQAVLSFAAYIATQTNIYYALFIYIVSFIILIRVGFYIHWISKNE
ncbi:undecaprenyl/decaprenyl-phosphate alpha-N-acetylglucosaminyl 1-phosphate transferase [candidate division WOR-3 bacterium]|nr:undecaprenyl/decaprenyl-phosphate alpha-N-acetylglucosaminyl 1-phosphate transferase [candidate division WOR-3 bacterium]